MYEFNIELDNNNLDQYDNMLSRFKVWSRYKREIKLNLILESNKKIEFKVDIEDHKYGAIYVSSISSELDNVDHSINNACAVVKSMTFIINGNSIESLKIEIKTISTYYGKIISEILKSGISVKINQYVIDGCVSSFYILDRDKTAA